MNSIRFKLFSFLLILLIIISNCSKNKIEDHNIIPLVKIGDRIISKDEFIRRAEYTVRPPYAKLNYNHQKKIILNSLIAEKMFAMGLNSDSLIQNNKQLSTYIKGRKEQAMRQAHYHHEAMKMVNLDDKHINKIYQKAGREYDIKFITLPNQEVADEFLKIMHSEKLSFEDAVVNITDDGKVPERKVNFETMESKGIHNALFENNVVVDQIIGPIKSEDNSALIMKVVGWKNSLAISEQQTSQRYTDVKDRLSQFAAGEIYTGLVQKLMAGKNMEFDKNTFLKLSKLYAQLYNITKENQKEIMNNEFWGKEVNFSKIDTLKNDFENIQDDPFFQLDGITWTVKDFQEELKSHPLVFRKRNFSPSEFQAQFRFAIADLVRDKFITEDAYKKGYDKLNIVENYENMWKDNSISHLARYKYLDKAGYKGNFNEEYMQVVEKYLNPIVDSLQAVFSDQIELNVEEFNKIKLTRIDLFAMQNNVPYPIVAPSFPVFTTDSKLDYGKKME